VVRWRALVASLVGLLLTAPCVALLVSSSWPKPLASPESEQRNVAPMLSQEQRRQLATWRQPCRRSDDCDSPLVCFADVNMGGLYCTDSDCETNAECGEGFVCGTVATWNGELLRRCTLVGDRREGEACVPFSKKYARACGQGLLCNGQCGRPCQPDLPESCPDGFFCPRKGGPGGPSCLPTCEARGCAAGQECLRFREGSSVCAEVRGTNCQRSPCPEGQTCQTRSRPERPGKVWMRCVSGCSKEGAPCPEGFFCLSARCVRACDPDASGTCGPGEKCKRSRDGTRGACLFDFET
jgi:hypothetical protein